MILSEPRVPAQQSSKLMYLYPASEREVGVVEERLEKFSLLCSGDACIAVIVSFMSFSLILGKRRVIERRFDGEKTSDGDSYPQ